VWGTRSHCHELSKHEDKGKYEDDKKKKKFYHKKDGKAYLAEWDSDVSSDDDDDSSSKLNVGIAIKEAPSRKVSKAWSAKI
jgi:hypothetical protein